MHTARNIIPDLSEAQAAEYLDVEQITDFEGDMRAALQAIHIAKRFAAGDDSDVSQAPPPADQDKQRR